MSQLRVIAYTHDPRCANEGHRTWPDHVSHPSLKSQGDHLGLPENINWVSQIGPEWYSRNRQSQNSSIGRRRPIIPKGSRRKLLTFTSKQSSGSVHLDRFQHGPTINALRCLDTFLEPQSSTSVFLGSGRRRVVGERCGHGLRQGERIHRREQPGRCVLACKVGDRVLASHDQRRVGHVW